MCVSLRDRGGAHEPCGVLFAWALLQSSISVSPSLSVQLTFLPHTGHHHPPQNHTPPSAVCGNRLGFSESVNLLWVLTLIARRGLPVPSFWTLTHASLPLTQMGGKDLRQCHRNDPLPRIRSGPQRRTSTCRLCVLITLSRSLHNSAAGGYFVNMVDWKYNSFSSLIWITEKSGQRTPWKSSR